MIDKKHYDKIEIPNNLSLVVNEAIDKGLNKKEKTRMMWKLAVSFSLLFFITFTVSLNTIPAFASTMYKIPVLGRLCEILTFVEYHEEDDIKYIDVKIPYIDNKEGTDLEDKLNKEIRTLIDEEVERSKTRAKEYYDAFVETGGDPKEFIPVGINVDYQVKMLDETYASVVISKSETHSSAYYEQYFYNLNLETGKLFTLKDWFGPEYKEIVVSSIENTIAEWSDEQRQELFEEVVIADLITENRNFYLNNEKQAVIVFEKYEIAVGSSGILEFPIVIESQKK